MELDRAHLFSSTSNFSSSSTSPSFSSPLFKPSPESETNIYIIGSGIVRYSLAHLIYRAFRRAPHRQPQKIDYASIFKKCHGVSVGHRPTVTNFMNTKRVLYEMESGEDVLALLLRNEVYS